MALGAAVCVGGGWGGCLAASLLPDKGHVPRWASLSHPFSPPIEQVNDRFRSDLTAFIATGGRGLLSAAATRVAGEPGGAVGVTRG
jgi:hypothetical protein